ncbi:hypothetical protein DL769_006246 [Monosporascus sp. CRB-8-3]|nr:hypothetical protein DL769_006246 [Monosporascus sp. CRB-8-3]
MATLSPSLQKPTVVGIYGLPGSGKSYLLNLLKQELDRHTFEFYEGSDVIAEIVPGGLLAFQKWDDEKKTYWRKHAIDTIRKASAKSGKCAVVAGHFMFWSADEAEGLRVVTQNDLETYTHIFYLEVPPEVIAGRRLGDTKRSRTELTVDHLRRWQSAEIAELRRLCRLHGILFSVVPEGGYFNGSRFCSLIQDARVHTEEENICRVMQRLDELLAPDLDRVETILLTDADRTLASDDSGQLFWAELAKRKPSKNDGYPLKTIFGGPMGYSYSAFRQATLMYEEAADMLEFEDICEAVASEISLNEISGLLEQLKVRKHVRPIVVTCGLRLVWEKVLGRAGLSFVDVIGGGRIADGLVVTPVVKAAIVNRLRIGHRKYVWAFGDSSVDIPMLSRADQAIVVVCEEHLRSKTMESALQNAIGSECLRARQVLLPRTVPPRLSTTELPSIPLDQDFVKTIVHSRALPASTSKAQLLDATGKHAARLLMTPTRDSRVSGPQLREAHHRVGRYLAVEYVAEVLGVEEYSIPHVQGHQTGGYRVRDEQRTLIVALMRGGEPMALGVSDALPSAVFMHANRAEDIARRHLEGQRAVVLVDSVINSGGTLVDFVRHIRDLDSTIRIVAVTGVLQEKAVSEGKLAHALATDIRLSVVALRLSENKFTGKGSTDTGNRLFNTTHLP